MPPAPPPACLVPLTRRLRGCELPPIRFASPCCSGPAHTTADLLPDTPRMPPAPPPACLVPLRQCQADLEHRLPHVGLTRTAPTAGSHQLFARVVQFLRDHPSSRRR